MSSSYEDKILWILHYCSEYSAHDQMYDERCQGLNIFNVDLGMEEYITEHIGGKQLVLLTGDAGDGKTRILTNLQATMKDSTWKYVCDFSELDDDATQKLLEELEKIVKGTSNDKYMIAANAGILFANLKKKMKNENSVIRSILKDEKCLRIDLSKRNLAKDNDRFSKIVKSFLDISKFKACNHCELYGQCAFIDNIHAVCKDTVLSNIWTVYRALSLEGYHVTIRDMLSSLAYIITGGQDCASLRAKNQPDEDDRYYNNIFKFQNNNFNGNKFLTAMAFLDPSRRDLKGYDRKNCQSCSKNRIEAISRKRKDFFEHQEKLLHHMPESAEALDLLNADYLGIFDAFLKSLNGANMLDSVENANSTIELIESGLNKLSDPYRTNSEMILYDSPPFVSDSLKFVFTMDVFQYLFCTEAYHKNNRTTDNDGQFPMMDSSNFVCVLYVDAQYDERMGLSGLPFLHIDYNLFSQILHAGNNVFRHANIIVRDSTELKSFIRAIITGADSLKSFSVKRISQNGGISDMKIAIMTPSKLAKNMASRLNISK